MTDPGERDILEQLVEFYRTYYDRELATLASKYPRDSTSLTLDWRDIYQKSIELADDFRQNPGEMLPLAEEALAECEVPGDVSLDDATVRIEGLPETVPIRDIRSHHHGQLVQIRGIVRKATSVLPKVTEANFECQRCGTLTPVEQQEGEYIEPEECHGCERNGPFYLNHAQSTFVNAQQIQIQENPEGLTGGDNPQTIDVHLEGEITGQVTAGDEVTVVGVLKFEPASEESSMFDVFLSGLSLSVEDANFEDVDIAEEDIEKIRNLADREDIYSAIVESIAPTIYGHDLVKLAIALQLFSGVPKSLPDGSDIRGNIHLLLMGEPGVGKSVLLQYIRKLAPRSVYTSGKGTSSAGLTAAAVRSDFGGGEQWTLEAGALVLADRGIAAVDELDKMREDDKSALHEGLEQQQVSISKAGINATLQARCSLLAAANPKYGRFDIHEPLVNQIDLEPPLISRFDLIFTIMDRPDPDRDGKLADHILQSNLAGELNTRYEEAADPDIGQADVNEAVSEVDPEIPPELFRKYISYAQTEIIPTMTDEAKEEFIEFYVSLRTAGDNYDEGPVPVTARKLEALIRLAEASARIRLSNTIDRDDARRVIEIVEQCMRNIGMDPDTGEFDTRELVDPNTAATGQAQIVDPVDLVKEIISSAEGIEREDLVAKAEDRGADPSEIESSISDLKASGEVYETPEGDLKVVQG